LCRELREQGYKGCNTIIYDYVRSIKPENWKLAKGEKSLKLRVKQAAWLMVRDVFKLSLKQIQQLGELLSLNAEVAHTYCLAQEFIRLLQERDVGGWGGWLEAVAQGGVPRMVGFKEGLLRDEAAVKNAMRCNISNGQVGGQVNRLKMLKRTMFGRAKFDLLKARVIGRPPPPPPQRIYG
jgi:transposase